MGAAICAAMGIGLYKSPSEIPDLQESSLTYFNPNISGAERDQRHRKWKQAVERSFDWHEPSC